MQFLDIILDLTNNSYTPYIKENYLTRYINFNSNHPTVIKKKLPKIIKKIDYQLIHKFLIMLSIVTKLPYDNRILITNLNMKT